jgi:hypothetical protein
MIFMNWGGGGAGNKFYYRYQTAIGQWSSSWNYWGEPLYGDPVVVLNGDGRLEVFMVGVDYKLFHTWQMAPGSVDQWTAWDPVGDMT